MQARLLLSAMFMAVFVPLAAAQEFDNGQQPAPQLHKPVKPKPVRRASKPRHPAARAVKKPTHAVAAAHTRPAAAPKARLLQKIGDWSVFIHETAGGRVCFAASAPTDMKPRSATSKRSTVVFYVTAWQKDGVRNEISVKLGYQIKPKSAAAVTAGGRRFSLPADEDRAFTKNLAEEQKLLAAMEGGGSMVVKATSARGTATTDQYSLEGLATAVRKAQQACL
jgi:Invasion associated locus B (IalB) protein